MKILKNNSYSDSKYIHKEIFLHMQLDHPNIIKFHNFIKKGNQFYLFLEYAANKDLFTFIHKNKNKLSELQRLKFFHQTCKAVEYLHQKGIMHRDLKPENILLDSNLNVKIADFGWSAEYQLNKRRETLCGTEEYMAPEVIMRKPQTKKTDIWALGILLYELYHDLAPFRAPNLSLLLRKIQGRRIVFQKNLNRQAIDLILKILRINPKDRLSATQILKHPLLRGFANKKKKPAKQPLTNLFEQKRKRTLLNSSPVLFS